MTIRTIQFPRTDLTGIQEQTTISSLENKRAGSKGFTLIEIIVVLAVITLVMSLGLPAISQITSQQLNSTTRKFVGMIRTVRNDSILLNAVYRIVLDFDHQTWWVETQRKFEMLNAEEAPKKKKGKKEDEEPSNFAIADKYSKKPVEMPGGVSLDGVLKEREGLIKKGVAFIHFFPNGFNDQAILYLNKTGSSGEGFSLVIQPTSGKVDIFRERVVSFEKF